MADDRNVSVTPSSLKKLNMCRKRKINMENWKDNVSNRKRNRGEEYTTRKGVVKPAKKAPEQVRVCQARTCENNGCKDLTYEHKQKLFTDLYSMDFNAQSAYLVRSIIAKAPTRRAPGNTTASSKRQTTFVYSIVGTDLVVCKKTFMDIYALSHKRVQVLQRNVKLGEFQPLDMRGKHHNKPKRVATEIMVAVKMHIQSFPLQESHYSRAKTTKGCLPPDLSLVKMYRMFKNLNPDLNVKKHLYRRIFKGFNLRFRLPRSDTCKTCDKLYNKYLAADSESEKRQISVESELHHRQSESAYSFLSEDTELAKANSNYVVLCVDLQQVLFCPTLRHSSVFYQRQLSNYDFAVHNMGQNDVSMYLWNESIAKRGSAEIVSCLLKHMTDNFKPLEPNEKRDLVIWSDRCVGQNNNWKVISLYSYFMRMKLLTSVEQTFLCSGHSFLPCDRDFALIEKKKRTCNVYIPEMWKYVIAEARIGKPFMVTEMQNKDFVDISPVEKQVVKDNKLKVTEVMWIKFSADEPSMVRVRRSHNVIQPRRTHKFIKQGISPFDVVEHSLFLPIYNGPVPISLEKYKDLCDMSEYLSLNHQNYYKILLHL